MVQRLAEDVGPADQIVVGQHAQDGECSGRADRVAAERAAVQAGGEQRGRVACRDAGADRQSGAQSLGQSHDVGRDPVVLVGEKRSGAAHSGLHLVEHQQRSVLGGDLTGRHDVAGGRDDDAALPHDRLEEHRRRLVVDRGGQCVDIAERDMGDVAGKRCERLLLGRLAGQREGAHRAAVERAFGGNEFRPAREPGDLEGHLVGLGTGVAEEHSRAVDAEETDERLRQRDAGLGGVQVRRVAQRVELPRDGLDHGGVAMAQDVDRDAAQQIEIGLAVDVGDHGAVTTGQCDRWGAVVVHHHGFPALRAASRARSCPPEVMRSPPSFPSPRR